MIIRNKKSYWIDHDTWVKGKKWIEEKEIALLWKFTGWIGYPFKDKEDIDDGDQDTRI